jgi:azurin
VATAAPTVAAPAGIILEISAKGDALEFDKSKLSAKSGAQVVLTFNNVSAINQHNWVIVQAGTKDAVSTRGTTAGPTNDWIQPGDPQVIAKTRLVDPGKKGEVRFAAPPAGRYQFVCTFPGHNFTMFGDFEVTP